MEAPDLSLSVCVCGLGAMCCEAVSLEDACVSSLQNVLQNRDAAEQEPRPWHQLGTSKILVLLSGTLVQVRTVTL